LLFSVSLLGGAHRLIVVYDIAVNERPENLGGFSRTGTPEVCKHHQRRRHLGPCGPAAPARKGWQMGPEEVRNGMLQRGTLGKVRSEVLSQGSTNADHLPPDRIRNVQPFLAADLAPTDDYQRLLDPG